MMCRVPWLKFTALSDVSAAFNIRTMMEAESNILLLLLLVDYS
jgi:hypothetical protein